MVAGRGTPDQAPARRLMYGDPATFDALIERITEATIRYLFAADRGGRGGGEAVRQLGWRAAGGAVRAAIASRRRGVSSATLRAAHPGVPVIGFPRGAGGNYAAFAAATGVEAVAIDTSVDPVWAAREIQSRVCVQGNLDPLLLVTGGEALVRGTRDCVAAFSGGPHVFNLGHGITPDADPANVEVMLRAIRG